jgi:ubiquinone/menaquinone biosynthesis C-methylase UbiE
MSATDQGEERDFWVGWQESWDRQQARALPDREERFSVLLSLIGAVADDYPPRVLDLACGCASITSRVLARFPSASVVAADLDPVLLRIAAGVFQGDDRVRLAEIDLRHDDWASSLPLSEYDAVVSATALHWLAPERLAAVYASAASLLRVGGVLANADQMPLVETPAIDLAVASLNPPPGQVGEEWHEWWQRVERTPRLASLLEERGRRFGGVLHPDEFTPSAAWHVEKLTSGGFSEAGVVWRRGGAAVVAALR